MCTHEADDSSPPNLYAAISTALTKWGESYSASPLSNLHLYREIERNRPYATHKIVEQILCMGLNRLKRSNPEHEDILRMRYLQKMSRQEVANKLHLSLSAVDRRQKLAIEALVQIISDEEHQALLRFLLEIERRLEVPLVSRMFGVDEPMQVLSKLLTSHERPWIISLEGIGGIGKTTLANALIRCLIQCNKFADFGWISARQDRFYLRGRIQPVDMPAIMHEQLIERLVRQLVDDESLPKPFSLEPALQLLHARLNQVQHVIVIDNLETVADVETLLPTLQSLANPTKFSLTSRKSLYPDQTIYQYKISPLQEADTIKLIRFEAHHRNSTELITATDDQLKEIYETVGGNPLALRLVVGQTCLFDLNIVLDNLKKAHGETVENLYEFIYRRSWERLNDTIRRVFIAMPLTPERGGSFEEIVEISGLDEADVTNALTRLVTLNLVDRQRVAVKSLYSIHSLTRTFLHEHVTHWQ